MSNLNIPHWALPDTRREALRELLQGTIIDRSIWHLLFASSAPRIRCYNYPELKYPWTLQWIREPVRIVFPSHPNIEIDIQGLLTTSSHGRVFPVQRDGFLCGTHSINALASAVVLTPASTLDTIALVRPNVDPSVPRELYAQREEIVLAALREGVVLGSVLLNNYAYFAALDEPSATPKCLEMCARSAGGIALLFSSGAGFGGHFVTLVPVGQKAWAIYDTDRVTNVRVHFGEALAAACRSRMSATDNEVVGLVPLMQNVRDDITMWRLATLCNMSAAPEAAGGFSINVPIYSPIDIEAASVAMERLNVDTLNLFTYFAARNRFENELSEKAEELARCLITIGRTNILNWRDAAPLACKAKLDDVPVILSQMASLQRSWLGVLCAPSSVLPNRDWLRYVAIHHCARRLRQKLVSHGGSVPLYKLAAALAAIAVTWHRDAGESAEHVRQKYAALHNLYRDAKRIGVVEVFGTTGNTTAFEQRALRDIDNELHGSYYFARNRLDRVLWLLFAFNHCEVDISLPNDTLSQLDNGFSDSGEHDADANAALEILRSRAFTPISRRDGMTIEGQVEEFAKTLTGTAQVKEQASVRYRRSLMAPKFSAKLASLGEGTLQRKLADIFAFSTLYAIKPIDDARIEQDIDEYPHLVEQACVRSSALLVYGNAFDACCIAPIDVDFATLSARVESNESFDIVYNGFDSFTALPRGVKRQSE